MSGADARRLAPTTMAALATALALGAGAAGVEAQALASRVASAPDGWVRFEYESRPGVCGNGDWITFNDEEGRVYGRRGGSCDCVCEEGPIRVEMRVRDGEPLDLEAEVGGTWRERENVTDLGVVPPDEAADYLLSLAERSRTEAGEEAIFPATLARGVETWPRLLEIARSAALTDTRRQAVFWLGQEASERATEGLTSIIDDEDELEVREHAVFALSQQNQTRAVDALIRIARAHPEPALRKRAIFWLGQRGDDPRVLDFLEELLTGGPR